MINSEEYKAYYSAVESYRLQPSRSWQGYDEISIEEDRILVGTCMLGAQISALLAMWESDEIESADFWLFVDSTYGGHIDGHLRVIDVLFAAQEKTQVEVGYKTIARYNTLRRYKHDDLGKSLLALEFIAIFLSEYWRASPSHRSLELCFPASPMFVERSFLDRCANKSENIVEWVYSNRFFETLNLTQVCKQLF